MSKTTYSYEPDYAVAPGETLAETLEALDMSQVDLASRTGLTVVSINRMIKGQQPITAQTANKLELVTGVPAKMWNNLEAQYQEQLARIEERNQLKNEQDWLKTIPTKELIKRKMISDTKDPVALIREVLAFFAVSSVATFNTSIMPQTIAARRSQKQQSHPIALATWLRLGELQAAEIDCQPYSKDNFIDAVKTLRNLTNAQPEEFIPKMKILCAQAGVAVALVPEMPLAAWYGASKWLTPQKAMILLNIRSKREDQFWFSFFHEASHILHDSKKDLFTNDGDIDNPCEQQANDFASNLLIPKMYRKQIDLLKTDDDVRQLAKKLAVSPGIVVGQFQYRTKKWNRFNHLIQRWQWVILDGQSKAARCNDMLPVPA